MVAKQQGNSFSLVFASGSGGWQGEGGTVEALWSLPASECMPTAGVAPLLPPPPPLVLSHSAPRRHPGVTAGSHRRGELRNTGSRRGQSDETARLFRPRGPGSTSSPPPREESLFFFFCSFDAESQVAPSCVKLRNLLTLEQT